MELRATYGISRIRFQKPSWILSIAKILHFAMLEGSKGRLSIEVIHLKSLESKERISISPQKT